MQKGKIFSIITCMYNNINFATSFFNSLLDQENRDFEVIVVDDSSINYSCQDINDNIYKYSSELSIRYIKQVNSGPGPARNAGLELAKGDYITFVDFDDNIEKSYFKTLKRILDIDSFDIITYGSYNMDSTLQNIIDVPYEHRATKEKIFNGVDFLCLMLRKNSFFVPVWLSVYKRKFLIDKNIKFLPIYFEDCDYTFNCFYQAQTVYYLDKVLHYRRIHDNSITHRKFNSKYVLSALTIEKIQAARYKQLRTYENRDALLIWNHICTSQVLRTVQNSNKLKWKFFGDICVILFKCPYMFSVRNFFKMAGIYLRRQKDEK